MTKKHPEKQMAMIFLDAEKAFDNVKWQFLIEQMREMDSWDGLYKNCKGYLH